MYHGFTDIKKFDGIENYHGKHIEIDKFCEQIEYLKKYYHIISLDQLLAFYTAKIPLPPRSVVITMDDGYRSNYSLAYPVLKEYEVPATIFVSTDFVEKRHFLWVDRVEYALNQTTSSNFKINIENEELYFPLENNDLKKQADATIKGKLKRISQELREGIVCDLEKKLEQSLLTEETPQDIYCPLGWQEVSEMVQSGLITIGSHTCSHVIMTQCSSEQMQQELKDSKLLIEIKTGEQCDVFGYPNGEPGDFDNTTKALLKEAGFICGLTTVLGVNDSTSDIFELKRLNVHNAGNLTSFIMTLSGFFRFLRKVKGWLS